LQKKWVEFLLVISITSLIFYFLPRIFYDDAGFILRHLDHFSQGYWFRYNINDPPVYGISGFIHGVFCGMLCLLHLASPEQALMISNLVGFIATSWFLFLLTKTLVKEYYLMI